MRMSTQDTRTSLQNGTGKTCLRCDWAGDSEEGACPNCGAPLYLLGTPGSARPQQIEDVEATAGLLRRADEIDPPVPAARREERGVATTHEGEPSRWSIEAPVPVVAAALILAFLLGVWLGPGREHPAPAASDVVEEGSANDGDSSPAPAVHVRRLARLTPNVDGLPFSFVVPTSWERHDFTITRSIVGPQGAEAILFWTTLPDPTRIQTCPYLSHAWSGGSVGDLTAAIARAPGTQILEEPITSSLGGQVWSEVTLTVRKVDGCQPGFLFRWPHHPCLGACWMEMSPGNRIDVWVTRVEGRTILFEAATTDERTPKLEEDIERIVGSIRFQG
jgi:hypothetical protein